MHHTGILVSKIKYFLLLRISCSRIMCFNQMYPSSFLLSNSSPVSTTFPLNLLYCVFKSRVHLVMPVCVGGRTWVVSQRQYCWRNELSLPLHQSIASGSSAWDGTSWAPPSCIMGLRLPQFLFKSYACSHNICEFIYTMTLSWLANTVLLQTSTIPGPCDLSTPSSMIIPELGSPVYSWTLNVWFSPCWPVVSLCY